MSKLAFKRPPGVRRSGMALPCAAAIAAFAAPAQAESLDPFKFFEGRTESIGTMKIALKKTFRTRTLGTGVIKPDGSLDLVQTVEDEGQPVKERRWKMRRVGPGRYLGTMSQAVGPITVDLVGHRYRFRFKMPGHVAVEQWITPAPGGKSAVSRATFRKFGVSVGSSDTVFRKLD